jgi:hypothetical protein
MYDLIVNMYNSIKSCIGYNDNKSDFFSSEVGVRQGENLQAFFLFHYKGSVHFPQFDSWKKNIIFVLSMFF